MKDIWTTQRHITEKKKRYIPYKIYSNCILEIPQNIKFTLENNVVTLKSGSVVALTGHNTYTTRTTTEDITKNSWASQWYSKKVILFIGGTGTWFGYKEVSKVGSGSSLPADNTNYDDFYLTTDYSLYEWRNGAWNTIAYSYPLCVIDVDSNGVVSFAKDSKGRDMIFNGAGFIGHHGFTYPNIKALLPNGFNEDGSLKSVEVISNSLTIFEMTEGDVLGLPRVANLDEYRVVRGSNYREMDTIQDIIDSPAKYYDTYIKSLNGVYLKESNDTITKRIRTYILKYSYNGTTVTDFTIRQQYEGATEQTLYNEEEYEVEYDRTFLNVGETAVFKAKNILETQEQSLEYEPQTGIDLKRFLDPDVKIQNETFEAYSIQRLSEQGINTIELLSNKETFKQVFDYKVAEADNEGMVAK